MVGTANKAVAEAKSLSAKDPLKASAQLRVTMEDLASWLDRYPTARKRLLEGRRRIVLDRLDTARKEGRQLIKEDCFQAAEKMAEELLSLWGKEAQVVGIHAELVRLRDSYGYLADLARRAGKKDPK